MTPNYEWFSKSTDLQYASHRWAAYKSSFWNTQKMFNIGPKHWRSNQSILNEINPEYSLEGLMLKLKLQNFDPPMQRANSLEKTLITGKIESRRRGGEGGWDAWMTSSTQWTCIWANSRRYWRTGKLVHGVTKSQTLLSNWTQHYFHWKVLFYLNDSITSLCNKPPKCTI